MYKILVIDNDKVSRDAIKKYLGAAGYKVLVSAGDEEGLDLFRREKPDVVVTEMKMPGMNGISMLKATKDIEEDTELIVITDHDDLDAAVESLRLGASDFLEKPLNMVHLEVAVERALSKQRMKHDAVRSANMNRSIINSAMDGIFWGTVKGTIIDCNPAFCNLLGYRKEELLKMNILDVTAKDGIKKISKLASRVFTTGSPTSFEISCITKEGIKIPVLVRCSAIKYADEGATGLMAVVRDLTEQKQAEEDLRISEKKYSDLVERANDPIFIVQDGVFKFVNTAMSNFTKHTPMEMIGMGFENVLAPDSLGTVKTRYKKRIAGEEVPNSYEVEILDSEGDTLPVEVNAGIIDYEGRPADMVFLRDISERKQAEAKLAGALAERENIMETVPDILYMLDFSGRFISWNNNTESITGFSADELRGKPAVELFLKENRGFVDRSIKKGFYENELVPVEAPLLKKNGTITPYQWNASPLKDEHGKVIGLCGVGRDITRQKEIEERLKKSEVKYRSLIEQMNEGIVILDEKGHFTFTNQGFRERLNYNQQELLGKHVSFIIDAEYREIARKQLSQREKGESNRYELTMTTKHGRKVPVLISAAPIFEGGVYKGSFSIHTDLSLVKKTQAQLVRTNNRLNAIINSATGFYIGTTDMDGNVNSWNKGAEIIMGYTAEEAVGKMHASEVLSKEVLESGFLDKVFDRVLQGGTLESETELKRKNGQKFPAYINATPLRDEEANLMGVLGIVQDITERKHTEEKLHMAQQEKLDLIEQTTESIISIGMSGRIEMANHAAESLFDRSREELQNTSIGSILAVSSTTGTFPDIFPEIEDPKHTIDAERIRDLETEAFRPDGSKIPVILNAAVRRHDQGHITGLIMAISDIRERKKMRRELMDLAHQSGMAEIATGVLHNVNNVLTSVNISSELIQEALQKSRVNGLEKATAMIQEHTHDLDHFFTADPKGKLLPEYLKKVTGALAKEREANLDRVGKLLGYIDQVKDLISTQQRYARSVGLKERINPEEILEDAVEMHAVAFDRYNVKVVRDYKEMDGITVDRQKLMQAFLNLVKNAREAVLGIMDDRQPEVNLKIDTMNNGDDKAVIISVRDNGIGIPEENRDRIFEYGFTTKDYGSGFGLHATALSIQEIGGNISVSSDGIGKGAEFVVELPV